MNISPNKFIAIFSAIHLNSKGGEGLGGGESPSETIAQQLHLFHVNQL